MPHCATRRNGRRVRKSCYRDRKTARYYRVRYAKKYGWKVSDMNIYRCPECGQYHIGRKRRVEDVEG